MPQRTGRVTGFYDKIARSARLTRNVPTVLPEGLQMYSRSLSGKFEIERQPGRCYFALGTSSTLTLMCPLESLNFFRHTINPLFLMAISWLPGLRITDKGVLPSRLPSMSLSAPAGLEETFIKWASAGSLKDAGSSAFRACVGVLGIAGRAWIAAACPSHAFASA